MPQFSMTESMNKTATKKFNITDELEPQTCSFRVQTASAVNITKSINRMRVSQRLHEIQNEQKSQGMKL